MASPTRTAKALKRPCLSELQQLALAIEALSEHVVLFDAEDRIVLANKAWRDLNQDIAEHTKSGTRFEDHLRALLQRKLIPEAAGCEEAWLRARLARHRNPSGPFEVERQDGRWVRIYEQRLPNGGTILIVSDVTEAKRINQALHNSEARFQAIVDNSPAKIHIKDSHGRYVLVNPLAEKLFGVTEAEALGKTTHEVFPQAQADAFAAHDRLVQETGKAIEQEEVWHRDDGAHTYFTVKFPIFDRAGELSGVGAIGTDITDRKKAEQRLRDSEKHLQLRIAELEAAQHRLQEQEAKLIRLARDLENACDQAESANRAKTDFLATMSHELRTPLNAILGFSEIIQTETLGPMGSLKYREYASHIFESGRLLLDLINDILDLSKVESGMGDLHEEHIEVASLARSVWSLIQHRAQLQGVALTLELPEELPALSADLRKMKQILVNLLSNAIKFTKRGGWVALKVRCSAGSGYVFQVVDTGIGIAPRDIPKALSQFGQVDSGLSRQHEGTGLGLPLAKALVELHGGSLGLESAVGFGTTVTVRLPAGRVVGQAGHRRGTMNRGDGSA